MERSRGLTFLLLPAMVIAVLVLLYVTLGNSFQLEALREQSVLEATNLLASEKADRMDKRIVEQDEAVRATLIVSERARFGRRWLSRAAAQTPTVRTVFLVDLTSPSRQVVAVASRGRSVEDERLRRLLVHRVLGDLELEGGPPGQLRHLHASYGKQSHLISYWQAEEGGRRYLVVAWHDVPLIVHRLFKSVYREREPGSLVNVVDARGRIVYGQPLSRGGVTLGRNFQTTLYKWRVNVTMTSTKELGMAVARRRTLEAVMVALSLAVVVAGMGIVFVAADRERRLSALKSEFVANVSHELKTPLSLVRMFTELLLSGRVESREKQRQYLQIINMESERLSALIENVLDFARAEKGHEAFELVESTVGDVVTRAVEVCRVRAEGTLLTVSVPDDLPRARIDERAIEVAVINLVDNALKYAAGGRVEVSVEAQGRDLRIIVDDDGPGIAEADRKRIFERFVRGAAADGAKVRGSGIGLALVKQIATAHGGRVWVDGRRGGGSRFVLTIRTLSRTSLLPGDSAG